MVVLSVGPAIAVAVFVAGPGAQSLQAQGHLLMGGIRAPAKGINLGIWGRKQTTWYI